MMQLVGLDGVMSSVIRRLSILVIRNLSKIDRMVDGPWWVIIVL